MSVANIVKLSVLLKKPGEIAFKNKSILQGSFDTTK